MTRRIPVELGERSYEVVVGEGVRAEAAAPELLGGRRKVAVISQGRVARRWAPGLVEPLADAGVDVEVFLMDDGEQAKSLATVESLCRSLAAWGLLRGDAVVALGGGVVGDTAGFTAAAYHRGVTVVQVPTTLLAQVDAAIGGKTGVNLPEGKNLVGAFHQPAGVLADIATLATLPEREFRAGLGEVSKYAFMGDSALAAILDSEEGTGALSRRDPAVLTDVVARSAAIKAAVVSADEHERTGLRATLNYGHTLAHALETAGRYDLLHGEAVAVGLVFAAGLAAALDRLDDAAVDGVRASLTRLGLPVTAPAGADPAKLTALMRRDKKATGGLTFVLPAPGGGPLERVDDPPPEALARAFAAVGL